MAITEYYVSSLAGGGGDGSIGSPWTLTEALTDSDTNGAGRRYNIKADGAYTLASDAVGSGSVSQPCILRGYTTTIGDGNLGRDAEGKLITTNMPTLNLGSGVYWSPGSYIIFESLNFVRSANTNAGILHGGNALQYVNCRLSSTDGTNSGTCALNPQNYCAVVDCDIEMTGATYGNGIACSGAYVKIVGCRIKVTGTSANAISANNATTIANCLLYGNGLRGIYGSDPVYVGSLCIVNCTGHLPNGTFLVLPASSSPKYMATAINCHVTDSTRMFDNGYYATEEVPAMRAYNRTRDNANADRGFGDWPIFSAVTTDTGDDTTDYTDASSDDFTLISAAPGKGAGLMAYTDIGAYQREEPAGSSGGGSFVISG